MIMGDDDVLEVIKQAERVMWAASWRLREEIVGRPPAIRALTMRPPRAWATIHGGKDVENRSWRTVFSAVRALLPSRGQPESRQPYNGGDGDGARRSCPGG
jgi:hypothetical protein